MDINQPQNNPAPSFINPLQPEKKSVGPTIGLVIVVILIILGGIYFWNQQQNKDSDSMAVENEAMMIKEQGTSNEVSSIEADLNATNLDNLDQELGNIDADLQAQ